ncbi:Alpha-D-ribose 1-methylphosphonate 5-triphosphate synthase subunit PhnH [Devosia equisanguinis]|uniref:Alpha-D-ribose 1-methylphosphonate 5-triphosphate synthase subunit PhnH n=1 Tax=Devosia equisanguinis TaxID=2490941 RepID=A0A447IFI6_9HYPH|nr:phosphonate C-P lyase system protein PhnH [Devosia equisanguinis]VDS06216.1 Alpha-D-ribose 1-methylphosphonate 5-triphosphate synthase subunit PhnH [Devosia equisanguinis]
MSVTDLPALQPGFADAVFEGQASFRALLDAMSYPGRIQALGVALNPPTPLDPAMAALALTVLDFDTPVWLDPLAAATTDWLRFHAGSPVVTDPGRAQFALIADAANMPPLDAFAIGEDQYPDRSATLFIQVSALGSGQRTRWTGPGINGAIEVWIDGLPAAFWQQFQLNAELFPLGVDVVFVSGRDIVGLPRSIRVEV